MSKRDLQDQVKRDFLGPEDFGELFGSRGLAAVMEAASIAGLPARVLAEVGGTVTGFVRFRVGA